MFFFKKRKFKMALKANDLVRTAITMGVFDKYFEEECLGMSDFELQLLGRALNWAIPDLMYNLESDVERVENVEFRKRLKEDDSQIFHKGLEIINSDSDLEKLLTYYMAYELYLADNLFSKSEQQKYPGILKMKKFLTQTSEQEPDVMSPNFKTNYQQLFGIFNQKYGKYGKTLEKETMDSLFSMI